jgi:hypothetical protein
MTVAECAATTETADIDTADPVIASATRAGMAAIRRISMVPP